MSSNLVQRALSEQFGVGYFEPISGRGNSQVGRWIAAQSYFVKIYPRESTWDRRATEWNIIDAYEAAQLNNIPKCLYTDAHLNFSVFNYIEGVSEYSVSTEIIKKFEDFLIQIQRVPIRNQPGAKEHFFDTRALASHIFSRLEFLQSLRNETLSEFISRRFIPLLTKFEPLISKNINLESNILISPSDFGTHNTILTPSNELYFIDFEYGGVDTIFKLLADIYWSPGNRFDYDQRIAFAKNFLSPTELTSVFLPVLRLMGLKWALLVLNEFNPKVIEKRRSANLTDFDVDALLHSQLVKSANILTATNDLEF